MFCGRLDGRADGRADWRTDKRTGGWAGGRTDGRTGGRAGERADEQTGGRDRAGSGGRISKTWVCWCELSIELKCSSCVELSNGRELELFVIE